jgi:hypothetical protein
MKRWRIAILGGVAAAALGAGAQAQKPYPLHDMNFDMWCQEEQHLPPDRCDQRLPADDAAFQSYRATIEKYEIPYLQRRDDDQNLNRVILNNDPIDNPTQPSAPQVQTPAEQESSSGQH